MNNAMEKHRTLKNMLRDHGLHISPALCLRGDPRIRYHLWHAETQVLSKQTEEEIICRLVQLEQVEGRELAIVPAPQPAPPDDGGEAV